MELETTILVLILFVVWTVALPMLLARPLLTNWSTLPRSVKWLATALLPSLIPVFVIVFDEIDKIVTARVERTINPVDDLAWNELRADVKESLEELRNLVDTQNVFIEVANEDDATSVSGDAPQGVLSDV